MTEAVLTTPPVRKVITTDGIKKKIFADKKTLEKATIIKKNLEKGTNIPIEVIPHEDHYAVCYPAKFNIAIPRL